MNLEQIQRAMFHAIQQPLTSEEGMRHTAQDGTSQLETANSIIKPNDRLTSFERLELYNRQYWWRILSALAEDFSGLQAILGAEQFEKLSIAYLSDCPSKSFTMRNLGSRLEAWMREHPEYAPGVEQLAIDMVRLEWAEVEVFDESELPRLTDADFAGMGEDPVFHLQPYLRLFEFEYPVDEWLIALKHGEDEEESEIVSNAVTDEVHEASVQRSVPPLPIPERVYVCVHRLDYSVYFKRLEPEAFALLQEISRSKPVSVAIDSAVNRDIASEEHITGKLHEWFADWSSHGWFCKSGAES